VQFAETPAKGLVLFDRHGLITKEDHEVSVSPLCTSSNC
jgi:hypothetical protein